MLLHETAEYIQEKIETFNLDSTVVLPPFLFIFVCFVYAYDPTALTATLLALVALSPIWLPIFLFVFFWVSWIHYIRWLWWFDNETAVLEIQLPAEVEKSPLAMELFLTALWNAGHETSFLQRVWKGQYRPTWSLEIAGSEGRVNFYFHFRKAFKNVIEARLYGQFPEAKITEVPDYAAQIPFNLDEYELFGTEYQKAGNSPQAVPIKTYVDYGLDKNDDQEYRVDPISNTLELLGSMGKDEYFWFQIICKARKKDEWYGFYLGRDEYKEGAKEDIMKLMKGAGERAKGLAGEDEQLKAQAAARGMSLLTTGEKDRIEAMERSLGKLTFECGLRTIYFAKKEKYKGENVPNTIRFFDAFRPMVTEHKYNSLGVTRGMSDFDYPWQDVGGVRRNQAKRLLWSHYKNRAYFYIPYDQAPVMLSVEEMATLWHFPGSIVKTPGLSRVSSRRADAPPNLPTLPS